MLVGALDGAVTEGGVLGVCFVGVGRDRCNRSAPAPDDPPESYSPNLRLLEDRTIKQ